MKAAGLPLPARFITATDITHGKPHPEPFLMGAAALGYPATECVVFEDIPAGVQSGKAAGAKVVAFTTTVPEFALKTAGADCVLTSCADVRLLEQNSEITLELNAR